jgi:V/A-type H+-transporting ATPase subunit I
MLGSAFNSLGMSVMGGGAMGMFFGVLILVFGHVLNLAMCCLGAFVHPLRLNFLEFFKNSAYEGTGRAYRPLGEKAENI